jgi:hypothetical protein
MCTGMTGWKQRRTAVMLAMTKEGRRRHGKPIGEFFPLARLFRGNE